MDGLYVNTIVIGRYSELIVGAHLTSRQPVSISWSLLGHNAELAAQLSSLLNQVLKTCDTQPVPDVPVHWAIRRAILELRLDSLFS